MAVRSVLTFPHPSLVQRAAPVTEFGAELEALAADLAETMYDRRGLGLAAPQVGVLHRVFVVDVAPRTGPRALHVLVNPVIERRNGKRVAEEGCLSLPGLSKTVQRAARVVVAAQDVKGEPVRYEVEGLLAAAMQHEHEHLEGVLLVHKR